MNHMRAFPLLRRTAAALGCALLGALAQAQTLPPPPEVAANAYLLMDVSAGQVLAERGIDERVEPASLTKLMTTYLVFDALRAGKIRLEQTFPVSERAWKMPGSRMFIKVDTDVPVDDLIKGMVVQSGNDATIALAEGVGGSVENFVRLMNEQAAAMGLKNTHYTNPEGLTEPGHYTSARDLATLSMRLMRDFPEYAHYHAMQKYRYPGTPASNDTNRNRLLFRDPTVDGLKTGHTKAAGYCLVATARRDFPNLKERRLLSVVLGTASDAARTAESQKLLNWGYTAYEGIKLFDAGQPASTTRIWKGKSNTLNLGREQPIVVAVPAGSATKITSEVIRPEPLEAPVQKGQTIATLRVKLGERTLAELPLQALETVERSGWFGRAWDAIRLLWN